MEFNFLKHILSQENPSKFIKEHENLIFKIIPELSICKGFNQNNMWHIYDIYDHILCVVDNVPNNINLRLAALFHDIGKPFVYKEDEDGVGHFYGHWEKSKEIFIKFANEYRISDKDKNLICNLIFYHDMNVDRMIKEEIKEMIDNLSYEGIIMLFELKKSDLLAQNPKFHYLLNNYEIQKQKTLKLK